MYYHHTHSAKLSDSKNIKKLIYLNWSSLMPCIFHLYGHLCSVDRSIAWIWEILGFFFFYTVVIVVYLAKVLQYFMFKLFISGYVVLTAVKTIPTYYCKVNFAIVMMIIKCLKTLINMWLPATKKGLNLKFTDWHKKFK